MYKNTVRACLIGQDKADRSSHAQNIKRIK